MLCELSSGNSLCPLRDPFALRTKARTRYLAFIAKARTRSLWNVTKGRPRSLCFGAKARQTWLGLELFAMRAYNLHNSEQTTDKSESLIYNKA